MTKLSDTAFVILLTLGQTPMGQLHGYGLLQCAKTHTGMLLAVGALYTQLSQLLQNGLIEEIGHPEVNSRRREYRITELGREACTQHATRLSLLATRILEWTGELA